MGQADTFNSPDFEKEFRGRTTLGKIVALSGYFYNIRARKVVDNKMPNGRRLALRALARIRVKRANNVRMGKKTG